jgi:hypothetical protein
MEFFGITPELRHPYLDLKIQHTVSFSPLYIPWIENPAFPAPFFFQIIKNAGTALLPSDSPKKI